MPVSAPRGLWFSAGRRYDRSGQRSEGLGPSPPYSSLAVEPAKFSQGWPGIAMLGWSAGTGTAESNDSVFNKSLYQTRLKLRGENTKQNFSLFTLRLPLGVETGERANLLNTKINPNPYPTTKLIKTLQLLFTLCDGPDSKNPKREKIL